ncbi:protein [Lentinula edodes]|uniref:Protein n=1 Tax=Lentinula edodes TaxID=5353 RepID=A0A1Q3DXS5_LENED|nr:protein [Lentinula edodes]
MLSLVCSQKANNFQVIMGFFLLGSGAGKREIAVLAQAGLSVSPSAINQHVKELSRENIAIVQEVIQSFLCSLVWDNLNFAFHIDSQRLGSKDHFDSGTTVTVVVQHDPDTGLPAKHGTLSFDMKPPRTSTHQIISNQSLLLLPSPDDIKALELCEIWQLTQLALEHEPQLAHLKDCFSPCPTVEQIALHVTKQYPAPAMHEDESSLDGTIRVYLKILRDLGVSDNDIQKLGLFFTDGDLLTDSLVDKVESGHCNSAETEILESLRAVIRRFGVFHAKMAGARMVINEHWGKPNSPWPGSLWWEHTNLLRRKPISAGWQSKKAAPWKPTHELIQISLAGHILDAFRLHCSNSNFNHWASQATLDDLNAVSKKVYANLFSSAGYEKQREMDQPDTVLMNNILYNRDALRYWLLVKSIKAGDIGRVVLVLRIWMLMMRTPKTMPRYANAIFETLGHLQQYPERLRKMFLHNWLVNLTGRANGFKEVDLLQEHTNFWIKMVYGAKGVNRNWEWLTMISVCIYSLRKALRTVQKTFDIPIYGTQHTTPNMEKEVQLIAEKLKEEKIQEYVLDRPANAEVELVHDLIGKGVKYANRKSAYAQYQVSDAILKNLGVQGETVGADSAQDPNEDSEDNEEYYIPTAEDLAMDDEEPIELANELLDSAMSLIEEE